MNWSYSYRPDIWPALITLALAIYLGSYSWQRRHIPAAKPFTIACVLGGFWALGVILELLAVDFSTKVFWVKFQVIWQMPVATAITCFVLRYAGRERWLTRRTYAALFIVPLLCTLVILTNNVHHLLWTGFRMNGEVIGSPGKLFWVFIAYVYLLGLFNFAILIHLAVTSPAHRRPVAIMVCGQIIARVGYTLDKIEAVPMGPGESVLLVLGVVSVAYGIAFLRFHAIDPVGAARMAVIDQMREGLIVLDSQARIADINPMAAVILGKSDNLLKHKHLVEVIALDASLQRQVEDTDIGQADVVLDENDSARHFYLNWTSLKGRQGEQVGKLLLVHDVTEQKRAHERILEQQSIMAALQEREHLARELHDGIGQVLGYVSVQAQTALKWVRDGNSDKAGGLLERLVEVAKDAHADVRESIVDLKTDVARERPFIPALKKYIDRFQANYGIPVELSGPTGMARNTFDPAAGTQLLRVIQEALTNARKHSGAQTISICAEQDGGRAHITIRDDGNGFDVSQFERSDGEHFGLVFMRERMAQTGGYLKIESIPGSGTVLKLEVPVVTKGT